MRPIIVVEHISKFYRLGAISSSTLHEDLRRWWQKARGRRAAAPHDDVPQERLTGKDFWALRDVTFKVDQGDVIGIIGRNGAGKSTLLKVLSQLTTPTSGRIRYRGRVASLLEVGTGFHPDLTGRENVFLNGAIMGMSKAEIARKFDEIVAFSECEAFIDTPVKRYSSGMYVRLAFAVAAHLQPEILIVDEVLAVGDAQFQQKCLGKMGEVSRAGRTVLFVSHSMAAVSALCTRAILLVDGRIKADGGVREVASEYQAQSLGNTASLLEPRTRGTGKARFTGLSLSASDAHGQTLPALSTGCNLTMTCSITCYRAFDHANVGIEIYDPVGQRLVDANSAIEGQTLSMAAGETATVTFTLRELLLKPGLYRLALSLNRPWIEEVDYVEHASELEMHQSLESNKHTEVFPGVYQCRFDYAQTRHAEGHTDADGRGPVPADAGVVPHA
jgi:lipopolysaccharide transport system ATP-binding protein